MDNPVPLEHSRFSALYITDPELRAGLDAIVYNSLRPVAATLGALYAVFAVSH
ncbi:MAG: hypothetical protein HOP18_20450, partial [Deltaproteobacteria bacterium]|nr:hypothetical protein [Deltaproteobacteria bacterium]